MTISQSLSRLESSTTQHLESNAPNLRFRESSAVSSGDITSIFLITALLLASFSALAYYAKQKGWLQRFFGKSNLLRSESEHFKVSEVMRISKHTTLYRIDDGGNEFILIESAINTTVHLGTEKNGDGVHR